MKKGFALPLVIVLFLAISLLGLSYWQFALKSKTTVQDKLQEANVKQVTGKDEVEVTTTGRVVDVTGGPTWVGEELDFRDTKVTIKTQEKKLLTVIIPGAKDKTRKCPNDNSPEIYTEIEVKGTETEKDVITCQLPQHYIKFITPTKPITLKSFTDSIGKEKYVVMDIKKEPIGSYWDSIYIGTKEDQIEGSIKIAEVGASSIAGSPYISTNVGMKYLLIAKYGPGDGQDFVLSDENGRNIKIDFSNMGLGTTIPGMYGLHFVRWEDNTTKFIINAVSGNGHTYEATFDAISGKQIGETKVTE